MALNGLWGRLLAMASGSRFLVRNFGNRRKSLLAAKLFCQKRYQTALHERSDLRTALNGDGRDKRRALASLPTPCSARHVSLTFMQLQRSERPRAATWWPYSRLAVSLNTAERDNWRSSDVRKNPTNETYRPPPPAVDLTASPGLCHEYVYPARLPKEVARFTAVSPQSGVCYVGRGYAGSLSP